VSKVWATVGGLFEGRKYGCISQGTHAESDVPHHAVFLWRR